MRTYIALDRSKNEHHALSSTVGRLTTELAEAQAKVAASQRMTEDTTKDFVNLSAEITGLLGHLEVWKVARPSDEGGYDHYGPMTLYKAIDKSKEDKDSKIFLELRI